MGPTREAPFPRPCSDCSPNMTPREIQVAQTQWLFDNADRADVKQILARSAVMQAGTYAKVVELRPPTSRSGLIPLLTVTEADLVIDGATKRVLKDRYGAQDYKLSDSEYRRIRDDCGSYEYV